MDKMWKVLLLQIFCFSVFVVVQCQNNETSGVSDDEPVIDPAVNNQSLPLQTTLVPNNTAVELVTVKPTNKTVTEVKTTVTVKPTVQGVLNDQHVLIGPPENLTVFFTGDTFVVISWDAPPVYHAHDITEENVVLTKHPGSFVAKHPTGSPFPLNKTSDTETDNKSSASSPQDDSQSQSEPAPSEPPTPSSEDRGVKCQTLDFFQNYTIGLNYTLDPMGYSVIQFHEQDMHTKQNVSFKDKEKRIVPFNEGCLVKTGIIYEDKNRLRIKGSPNVSATTSTYRITGLKPNTEFEIFVRAFFINDQHFDSGKIVVKTMEVNTTHACTCDPFGSNGVCEVNKAPQYCTCEPGYQGQFCSTCDPGYYRVSTHQPCHRCPCGNHSSQVPTCSMKEGFLQCDKCHQGYRGNICHLCEKNHYRLYGKCVPCFCSGHSDPDARDMCHRINGVCTNCMHNTTGFNCERCLPGHAPDGPHRECILSDRAIDAAPSSSSSVSPGVIAAAIVAVVFFILLIIGGVWLKKNRNRREDWKFWTVEMRRDQDEVDVHNDVDDVDDLQFYGNTSSNKYSRLHEDL